MNNLQRFYLNQHSNLINHLVPVGAHSNYRVLNDNIGEQTDILKTLEKARSELSANGRIVFTSINFLWQPIVTLAEYLKIKRPQPQQSWLSHTDIKNLLYLANFEVVTSGTHLLLPIYIPYFSSFINQYIARLPIIKHLCLIQYFVAKKIPQTNPDKDYSVSIIVPARNESGTIETIIKNLPYLGTHTEIIFVEGHSKDGTNTTIRQAITKFKHKDIKLITQTTTSGKGDAVRKGFNRATGDILVIFDADLSMSANELPIFYHVLRTHKADFVMGSRLIYPMENQAMRFLNILGNKAFSLIFSWILNLPVKDTLCGTKCLFKKDYQLIAKNRAYFGDFDPFGDFDLILGASKANLKIIEVPIHYKARVYGKTNISRFRHGWLLVQMTLFAAKKLKFF